MADQDPTIRKVTRNFCDFCSCQDCRTGDTLHRLTHAPTADGRHICDVCWRYDECVRQTQQTGPQGKVVSDGPCEDKHGRPIADCPHRPKLIGPWTTLQEDLEAGPAVKIWGVCGSGSAATWQGCGKETRACESIQEVKDAAVEDGWALLYTQRGTVEALVCPECRHVFEKGLCNAHGFGELEWECPA